MERNCDQCGTTFTAAPSNMALGRRFCGRACHDMSRRGIKKDGVPHRLMRAKGHPIAPPSGTVAVGRINLYEKIGAGSHPCHWCGKEISWMPGVPVATPGSLLVDHLDHDPTNDDPANLVPSCNLCNAHRRRDGVAALIKDGEPFVVKGTQRHRATERTCEYCGVAFLVRTVELKAGRGRGRFCSMTCARSGPRGPKV